MNFYNWWYTTLTNEPKKKLTRKDARNFIRALWVIVWFFALTFILVVVILSSVFVLPPIVK